MLQAAGLWCMSLCSWQLAAGRGHGSGPPASAGQHREAQVGMQPATVCSRAQEACAPHPYALIGLSPSGLPSLLPATAGKHLAPPTQAQPPAPCGCNPSLPPCHRAPHPDLDTARLAARRGGEDCRPPPKSLLRRWL
jgi:hypothetical protein